MSWWLGNNFNQLRNNHPCPWYKWGWVSCIRKMCHYQAHQGLFQYQHQSKLVYSSIFSQLQNINFQFDNWIYLEYISLTMYPWIATTSFIVSKFTAFAWTHILFRIVQSFLWLYLLTWLFYRGTFNGKINPEYKDK